MPPLRARTLREAYLYLMLTAGREGEPGRDHEAHTTLTEGQDAWTLRFDGRALGLSLLVEVLVPYASEAEARRDRLPYGAGRSELVDAGQWRLAGATFARRAMREDLLFAASPGDPERFRSVVLAWESARDATAEAARFLPPGAAELPDTAFWTEQGTAARRDAPGKFTRASLESDLASYQETLDDFIVTHTTRDP
ncbi:hypothetical protein Sme01_16070 [Sphaerisporangium melleum]|uniref:Uncharacterized protein n=1 Tax=Sphaerisporangium melleum TaxID=321316 RepID=A0A917RIW0_9ACTN|nr:hypothetical protein [Sphaerisporangium melleum]GGL10597.1 hypothetical protein GCM10007964_60970 [Sphaerisporangium melleum]GII69131.1 hypothetical protein Sme01_16070 [Sphaerisporangium melleum]